MARRYFRDHSWVALRTSPAPDGHRHVAVFDDDGSGWTTVERGHRHRVFRCDVMAAAGHAHEVSTSRVALSEDELEDVAHQVA